MNEIQQEFENFINDLLIPISDYRLELGILAGKSETRKDGVTNAELMFICEN